MFTVSVETIFRASHELSLPDGSKEPPHSHDWKVIAELSSEKLNEMGLVMDFNRVKAMVDSIVARFNNSTLEKHDYFQQNASSAEYVAKYIYERLESMLSQEVELEAVQVVEKAGCSAKFSKNPAESY